MAAKIARRVIPPFAPCIRTEYGRADRLSERTADRAETNGQDHIAASREELAVTHECQCLQAEQRNNNGVAAKKPGDGKLPGGGIGNIPPFAAAAASGPITKAPLLRSNCYRQFP